MTTVAQPASQSTSLPSARAGRPAARIALVAVRWFARGAMLALVTAILASIAILLVIPQLTQAVPMTVLTGSMSPGMPAGSMALVRPVDPARLGVGDVATYQVKAGEDTYITHRITEVDASRTPIQFTFQGDANRGPDLLPVSARAIRGEVWFHVPYLGTVKEALDGRAGISLIATLLLGGYAVFQLAGGVRDQLRGRRSKTDTDESPDPGDGTPVPAPDEESRVDA